jgi:hypothetical protein
MAFKLNNPTDPPSGSTNATAEELRQKRMDANKALEAERKRVANIRSRIDQVAESAAGGSYTVDYGMNDGRTGVEGAGVVPQKTFEWLQGMGGAACSTYACGIMREAGVTVPNSVGEEGVTINNVTYKPGDKMPIIPGNEQFDAVAPQLGFELRAPGSLPEEGDVTRVGYGYGYTSHSTIQTGEGRNVYNPGTPELGLKESEYYAEPSEFAGLSEEESQSYLQNAEEYGLATPRVSEDKKIYPTRLMQYVGDLPALRKQYREAAQAAGPEKAIELKPRPIQGPAKPTAQLPTNMLKFFNRNK